MKSTHIKNDLHKIMKEIYEDKGIPIERQIDDILRPALIPTEKKECDNT